MIENSTLKHQRILDSVGVCIMDARTFGQFIGFPFVQLQGTDVQKVNISTFYTFAKWMYDLRKLSAGDSLSDQETLRIVLAAKIGILLFFQPSTDAIGFPHTSGAVQRLWDFLDKNTDPKNTTDTLNPEGILDDRFINAINSYVDSFETMFHQEGATANVFAVTKKGIFELDSLIASAVESLPPVIVSRLSADAVHNINAAGRCLALDSPTACGFHILRAVESLMRDYHFKLTGAALAVKSRNWGAFIKELNKHGADPKVTAYLTHIKDFYRNPIVHPEENLSTDQAYSLFTASLSAITMLDAAINP